MQKRVCVVAALLLLLLMGCTGREEKERGYLAADHKFYQAKDYKRAVIALPQCGAIRADRSGSTISTRTGVLALGGAHSATTAFGRNRPDPKHAGAQPRFAQQIARGARWKKEAALRVDATVPKAAIAHQIIADMVCTWMY